MEEKTVSTARNDIEARMLTMIDRMPAFPQAVNRILELSSNSDCAPRDLVEVIEHDPVMTVKLLKLVNSAWFGLARPINSIHQAIVFVGINTVKNLALTIAAMGVLPPHDEAGLKSSDLLLHSLGVATLSKVLAQKMKIADRETSDYFIAGLLHDFGKVVFARHAADEFSQALQRSNADGRSLHLCEQESIGVDHAELGGRLAESWKLSPLLSGSIRYHHDTGVEGEWSAIRDSVFAANQIVRSLHFGHSGNPRIEAFPEPICDRFDSDLTGLIESLGDLTPALEQSRIFLQL